MQVIWLVGTHITISVTNIMNSDQTKQNIMINNEIFKIFGLKSSACIQVIRHSVILATVNYIKTDV